MMTKIHLHSEQFDGHQHPTCGRGTTAVTELAFEAAPRADRCQHCERDWFPNGQPDRHHAEAVKRLAATTP